MVTAELWLIASSSLHYEARSHFGADLQGSVDMTSYSVELAKPASPQNPNPTETVISPWQTALFAIACGLLVANVYISQPIAGPIAAALGLSTAAAGIIVTFTQLGFGVGLFLIVPVADLIENRRLVLALIGIAAAGLLGAALSSAPLLYFLSALLVGIGSVAVHVLVPYASHMCPEEIRGRVVGNVMSGLMIGVLLARPLASFVTQLASWHVVFYISAANMFVLALVLRLGLPKRTPVATISYRALLKSMGHLSLRTPILQRRAFYQFCLFSAFSLFWTTVPLLLIGPTFRMSQGGLALFASAGGAGALAAPIAGRLADSGWTRPATAFGILAVAAAFLLTRVTKVGTDYRLILLVTAAILLDFGMTANLTLGQRAIFVLGAQFRSRLNGLYMSTFFAGGAVASALGGWGYAEGGWSLASWLGFAFPIAALAFFVTERRATPLPAHYTSTAEQ
jgi:predicted MFS family arabinose efflux permease